MAGRIRSSAVSRVKREKISLSKRAKLSMGYKSSSGTDEDEDNLEEGLDSDSKEDLDLNELKEEDEEELPEIKKAEYSDDEEEGVSGWADSMARILASNKPKNKKSLILSRAKLDHEVKVQIPKDVKRKATTKNDLEVVGVSEVEPDKKVKVEESEKELSIKQKRRLELVSKKEKKEWENLNRIKPTRNDPREKEILLLKIATKGVVQLFNAVNIQQKATKNQLKEVQTSEFKKDKVLKKTKEIFDSAMEKSQKLAADRDLSSSNEGDGVVEIKDEDDYEVKPSGAKSNSNDRNGIHPPSSRAKTSKKPTWKALHDDFMLDAKMKDWDKSSDSDE